MKYNKKSILTMTTYEAWGDGFGDYLRNIGIKTEHFVFLPQPKKMFRAKKDLLFDEIYSFIKLFININKFRKRKLFCSGCHLSTMLFYKLLKIIHWEGHLYMHNFYLHGMSKKKIVQKILHFLMYNENITLICQSPNEINYYRTISDKINLEFIPYSSDFLPPPQKKGIDNHNIKDYFFCGGYTNRDYELIFQLAKKHPERTFLIIVSSLNTNVSNPPQNVIVLKDQKQEDFENYLSNSLCVIIALKEDVGSSGQMLAISAMRNKKPIIYTDVGAINYYFCNDCAYSYQIGDIDSLDRAYCSVISNSELAKLKGERAFIKSQNYTLEKCYESIYKVIYKKNGNKYE